MPVLTITSNGIIVKIFCGLGFGMLKRTLFYYNLIFALIISGAVFAYGENSNDNERVSHLFDISVSCNTGYFYSRLAFFLSRGLNPPPDIFLDFGLGVKAGIQVFPDAGFEFKTIFNNISAVGPSSLNVGFMTVFQLNWYNRFFLAPGSKYYLKPYYGVNYSLFNLSQDVINLFSGYYPDFNEYRDTAGGIGGQAGLEFGMFLGDRFIAGVALELCMSQMTYVNNEKKYMFFNFLLPVSIGIEF